MMDNWLQGVQQWNTCIKPEFAGKTKLFPDLFGEESGYVTVICHQNQRFWLQAQFLLVFYCEAYNNVGVVKAIAKPSLLSQWKRECCGVRGGTKKGREDKNVQDSCCKKSGNWEICPGQQWRCTEVPYVITLDCGTYLFINKEATVACFSMLV